MNQKGLSPILIVILIALGVGGYLIYQKQAKPNPVSTPSPVAQVTTQPSPTLSDETANWKTYENKQGSIKYAFRYPPNWISGGEGELQNPIFYSPNKSLWFTVIMISNGFSIKQIAEEESPPEYQLISRKDVTLSGYNAIIQEVKTAPQLSTVVVYVSNLKINEQSASSKKEGSLGSIHLNLQDLSNPEEVTQVKREFDQILSTFKFTD